MFKSLTRDLLSCSVLTGVYFHGKRPVAVLHRYDMSSHRMQCCGRGRQFNAMLFRSTWLDLRMGCSAPERH